MCLFRLINARVFTTAAITAGMLCLAVSDMQASTPPNVSFTATGTFSNPQVSGADTLKLAGEPFTINIVASAASKPVKSGPNWAVFSPLKMTGEVHSGLLGSTPVTVASAGASIQQALGPTDDLFETAFPVKIVGISLTINATLHLPAGTLPNQLIHPFAAVQLSPSTSRVTYSEGTTSTTLTIQSGTLTAVVVKAAETAGLLPAERDRDQAPVRYLGQPGLIMVRRKSGNAGGLDA